MSGEIGKSSDIKSGVIGAFNLELDCWRKNSHQTSTGDVTGFARYAPTGRGLVGKGMSVSGAIFTFPSTGLWEITACVGYYSMQRQNFIQTNIKTCTDGSSYDVAGLMYTGMSDGAGTNMNDHTTQTVYFGVADTSTHKCKFHWNFQTGTVTFRGDTVPDTRFLFKKLSPSPNVWQGGA